VVGVVPRGLEVVVFAVFVLLVTLLITVMVGMTAEGGVEGVSPGVLRIVPKVWTAGGPGCWEFELEAKFLR